MKVAIALDGDQVSGHFGHCEKYAIFHVAEGEAKHQGDLPAPPHEPGKLPVFLAEHRVNLVIAGGMGPKAVELFKQKGIDVLLGASGQVSEVAGAYAAGRLETGVSSCHH